MDPLIIPLPEAHDLDLVGSKAYNLSLFLNEGFPVPEGFSLSTQAYTQFVKENNLSEIIDMEIYRKNPEDMRWEEIWDASLRIRSHFLRSPLPQEIEHQIVSEIEKYGDVKFSVRSSSPVEDSAEHSFAGIHESYIKVKGVEEILKSVKLVWASLWSDRAILYRKELQLDSLKSSIAVLIQKMVEKPLSGLAFSRNPADGRDVLTFEVVEGLCSDLVDNIKEPEKWVLDKNHLNILDHAIPEFQTDNLMNREDLHYLAREILAIEKYFESPVDVEWTGVGADFTVLQVRPITTQIDPDQDRQWYLSLTPHFENLKKLADRVEHQLIPQLRSEGERVKNEKPENMRGKELADKISDLASSYLKWKDVYWEEFIPFAHGVRNFAIYYNDVVGPQDPYEFIELLSTDNILALQRNLKIEKLSSLLVSDPLLKQELTSLLENQVKGDKLLNCIRELDSDHSNIFQKKFEKILEEYFNISFENKSLRLYPELVLQNVIQSQSTKLGEKDGNTHYLDNFYSKAGKSHRLEAEEILRIGRLSWKLRDDDNILLGVLENQLLLFLDHASNILMEEGRMDSKANLSAENWKDIQDALLHPDIMVKLGSKKKDNADFVSTNIIPRQLVGQPSSPGLITGKACVVKQLDDFNNIKSGDILVVDAVEPEMTFLISVAGGIVERRGGMLVHSSIIAREMGIPAVNGVLRATELIKNGEIVTVNGFLGIVIMGEPDFNLELSSIV